MKRRQFVSASVLAASALTTAQAEPKAPKKEVYELRTYQLRGGSSPATENYLKDALIPALNRQNIKNVGVFKEMGKTEPARLYVLIPHPSWDDYANLTTKLADDKAFATASQAYVSLTPDKAPFARYSTTLMNAFDALPKMVIPNRESRIFELRTYEGFAEDAVRRKVKMFNVDELPIFNKTGLNPVFFGEVMAGEHMPCLTYMLTFKNMEERDANWKQFVDNPDWKRVSQLPEYANTVSNIIRVFLEPTPYSQI
ncbi:NIPSNAP family containing protein [Fibrisoma limi BUZ 3]|uniref:NIPSNAP family containing protein n=1 Tax=Fibrisoma limi BUZ 3 TaxID=1185876 RepID=I2GF70_9BACT|nr:NIPSNAP family protein [Fibrisoma limi]CCH52545.1 NIPSNAP family containing protein [Fibrisoma limi BUZ 3]